MLGIPKILIVSIGPFSRIAGEVDPQHQPSLVIQAKVAHRSGEGGPASVPERASVGKPSPSLAPRLAGAVCGGAGTGKASSICQS